MVKHRGLAVWQARLDAEAADRDEAQQRDLIRLAAAADVQQAEQRKASARALIRRLARQAVSLTATRQGISARPSALLEQGDRELIGKLQTELLELLLPPAELVA